MHTSLIKRTLMNNNRDHGAYQIMLAAERLFAEQSYEAVSTRQISRSAGQKNHSALQYHFGSKQDLLAALLDYRIKPINTLREQRLDSLLKRARAATVQDFITVFVEPLSEQLRNHTEETAYLSLLAQLYSYRQGRDLLSQHVEVSRSLHAISEQIIHRLDGCPLPTIHIRLQLMGRQTILAIAEWDDLRRASGKKMSEQTLQWRTQQLICYLTGGLTAPWKPIESTQ